MKNIQISTQATVYDSVSELSDEDKKLMDKAIEVAQSAYAPYSSFNVGASLLLDDGTIVVGSNQENAAYPSGMCAERVAIWHASAIYPDKKIKKLAIAAFSKNKTVDKPVGPCGACRQALLEYEIKQANGFEVIFTGEIGKVVKTNSVKDLLPFSFDASYL